MNAKSPTFWLVLALFLIGGHALHAEDAEAKAEKAIKATRRQGHPHQDNLR